MDGMGLGNGLRVANRVSLLSHEGAKTRSGQEISRFLASLGAAVGDAPGRGAGSRVGEGLLTPA
jgi:hypothetical protein